MQIDDITLGDTYRLTKMVHRYGGKPPILPGTVFVVEKKVHDQNGVDMHSVGGFYELQVSLDRFNEVFVPYP